MTPEIFRLITGLVLIIAEIFIPGVIIIFFGPGALITALTTAIGLTGDIYLRIIPFAVLSLPLLILFRNIIDKRMYKRAPAGKWSVLPDFMDSHGFLELISRNWL